MALHMQLHIFIAVQLDNSSPIFDVSQQTPFAISLAITLHHARPVTFDRRFTTLFNGKLLYDGGLTFTNIANGELVPRNTKDICYMGSENEKMTPSEQIKDTFVTLHLEKEYVLHATLQPILSNKTLSMEGLTIEEMVKKRKDLPKMWRWPNIAGMQDGEVYRVGITKHAGVSSWKQGSVESLLETRRAGLRPEIIEEASPFILVQSAQFEMIRPDKDGSSDWP